MNPSDFPNSDDIPDLSLPDRSELTPQPLQPLSRAPQVHWREGDRVLAPWEPNCLYVGRMAQLQDRQALIEFEDGDSGWVLLDEIRAMSLVKRGLKVMSRRQMGHQFFPGEIVDVSPDEVCVRFDDNQTEEWTDSAAFRVPCQPGQGAAPTKVASHLAFLDYLKPGDRVWAPWASNALFVGTVESIQGREAHIHFDDGDRGWVQLEQLVPLQLPVGLRVLGRWKMGGHFFPGTIAQLGKDRIFIVYDDGDKEWTTAAALAIPCQPFGPNARPTKTASRANVAGWVLPIILGLVFLFVRIGCR